MRNQIQLPLLYLPDDDQAIQGKQRNKRYLPCLQGVYKHIDRNKPNKYTIILFIKMEKKLYNKTDNMFL